MTFTTMSLIVLIISLIILLWFVIMRVLLKSATPVPAFKADLLSQNMTDKNKVIIDRKYSLKKQARKLQDLSHSFPELTAKILNEVYDISLNDKKFWILTRIDEKIFDIEIFDREPHKNKKGLYENNYRILTLQNIDTDMLNTTIASINKFTKLYDKH